MYYSASIPLPKWKRNEKKRKAMPEQKTYKLSEVLKLIYDIRVYSLTAILEEKYIV